MKNENISRMIDLSMKKKEYLLEILELSKKQETIIEEDKLDELDNILKEKEKIMGKIDVLDSEFLTVYNNVKDEENIDSFENLPIERYENLKDLKAIVNEINNILNTLTILDKNNISKMKANLEKTQADLKNVKLGKRAYKGYGYGDVGSIFIDEKK
ncbi:MAG: flagellar protein FlgN [Tissierellia bacterium]|nr:flagellar protein FlgN [Tissierellia bacterium]